jgi:hypothetical protein
VRTPDAAVAENHAVMRIAAVSTLALGIVVWTSAVSAQPPAPDVYALGLIAQSYERLDQNDKAVEYYRKVMASAIHNPAGAASRPLARQKLAALRRR